MRFSSALAVLVTAGVASSFSLSITNNNVNRISSTNQRLAVNPQLRDAGFITTPTTNTALCLSDPTASSAAAEFIPEKTVKTPQLTPEDETLITELLSPLMDNDDDDVAALTETLRQNLPRVSPSLLLAIRNAGSEGSPSSHDRLLPLQKPLESLTDNVLSRGKDTLLEFLGCGEIRKLDGAIGRAAKDGRLDAAFFTVLNANIADALRDDGESESGGGGEEVTANRSAILRHIYTRCQEEVEKLVDPGVALLNKLLRTDVPSIRSNQLRHYLSPQTDSNTITTPDGKTISLGDRPALVGPNELLEALARAVTQIRSVEEAGGADRVTAANLVEDCRQVAIEARLAILEVYGDSSEELKEFETGLQPVFRPGS